MDFRPSIDARKGFVEEAVMAEENDGKRGCNASDTCDPRRLPLGCNKWRVTCKILGDDEDDDDDDESDDIFQLLERERANMMREERQKMRYERNFVCFPLTTYDKSNGKESTGKRSSTVKRDPKTVVRGGLWISIHPFRAQELSNDKILVVEGITLCPLRGQTPGGGGGRFESSANSARIFIDIFASIGGASTS
jgi:hypothetical protein